MMVEPFAIAEVSAPRGGRIGLSPMPGRSGALAEDVAAIVRWRPTFVVSLPQPVELRRHGAHMLPGLLAPHDVSWRAFPIVDYGAPPVGDEGWAALAAELHTALNTGGGIVVHCMGGCGRSGMVALRLMVERGEPADAALARLRAARACAVETAGQRAWAAAGAPALPSAGVGVT